MKSDVSHSTFYFKFFKQLQVAQSQVYAKTVVRIESYK